jgi:uncharacterized protein YnzC (UPF0291/DUF896 family)
VIDKNKPKDEKMTRQELMRLSFEDVHKLYVSSFKSQFGRELAQITGEFVLSKKDMIPQILKEAAKCHTSQIADTPNE